MPVLDSGARGSTTTFVQRGIGDVLLAWENEALLAIKELGPDKVEIVVPSVSILAEPPVAVVDKNAEATARRKSPRPISNTCTRPWARRSPPSTTTARASRSTSTQEVLKQFPKLELFTVNEVFGSWKEAQAKHFDDGGMFDSIYAPQ